MATEEQICSSYQFYLQIMKKAGAHKEIDQKVPYRKLIDMFIMSFWLRKVGLTLQYYFISFFLWNIYK